MSYTKAYSFNDKVQIMIREDASRLGEPMNDKTIKIHRGIDNNIEIKMFDNKRRAFTATNKTLEAFFINPIDTSLVFRKPVTVTNSTDGLAEVLLTYADTANLDAGLYKMSVKMTDDNTSDESLLFGDIGQTAGFVVELLDGIMPEPLATGVADTFTGDSQTQQRFISNVVDAAADKNYTTGLHTIAVYTNGFTGSVYVEGSLQDNPVGSDFFPIPIRGSNNFVTYTASTGIEPFNFKASVRKLRFYYTTTAGTVTKILVRN